MDVKVLALSTWAEGGGAGRAALRIHQGCRALGVESRLLVKAWAGEDPSVVPLSALAPRTAPAKVPARVLAWGVGKVQNRLQQLRWGPYPRQDGHYKSDLRADFFWGALQKIDYEVLHLHWVNQRFLPLRLLSRVHKPLVWTLHDSWPFCGLCHYFLDCEGYARACGACPQLGSDRLRDLSHRLWRKKAALYRGLDLHPVAPSRWLARAAERSSLLGDREVRVIPNCLDPEVFSPGPSFPAPVLPPPAFWEAKAFRGTGGEVPRQAFFRGGGLEDSPWDASRPEVGAPLPVVLFGAVHAFTDRIKGFALLVEALRRLAARGPLPFALALFGAAPEELPQEVRALPLRLYLLGCIKETEPLVEVYRGAALTVVPSLTENLSCTLMESLACGTPVVAFDIGGNSDLVTHGVNGYLARPGDVEDLGRGLCWCLEHNADNALGRKAREGVLARFTPQKVCARYAALYEELASRNPKAPRSSKYLSNQRCRQDVQNLLHPNNPRFLCCG